MAYVRKTGVKCFDEFGEGRMLQIRAQKGKLLVTPREADEILADLQVMYHERTLKNKQEEDTWEPD